MPGLGIREPTVPTKPVLERFEMKRRAALFRISWLLAVALVGADLGAQVPTGVSSSGDAGAPVTLPQALQYDIMSRINGQTYRIFVSTPVNAHPTMAYP